jgi:hypothetical protein
MRGWAVLLGAVAVATVGAGCVRTCTDLYVYPVSLGIVPQPGGALPHGRYEFLIETPDGNDQLACVMTGDDCCWAGGNGQTGASLQLCGYGGNAAFRNTHTSIAVTVFRDGLRVAEQSYRPSYHTEECNGRGCGESLIADELPPLALPAS